MLIACRAGPPARGITTGVKQRLAVTPWINPTQWTARDWSVLAIVVVGTLAVAVAAAAVAVARARGWRWIVGPVMLVAAFVAVIGAVVANDPTAVSIWIGVAVTGVTTGFVDLSGLVERRRQLRPVERLVGRRIGRLHQLLLQLTTAIIDVQYGDARDIPEVLRRLSEGPLDLATPANVVPSRSRQEFAQQLYMQLVSELEAVPALQASGVLSEELDQIDLALRGGAFIVIVRDALPLQARWATRCSIAHDAANTIEEVQAVMPVAAKAAGRSWKYGDTW
jgi:hypothetical protein